MRAVDLRPVVAEALGTMLLLTAVIGSGVMAERLAGGNGAIALLANALATAAALWVLIELFAPISGAHFNPLVTLVLGSRGRWPVLRVAGHVAAQCVGAVLGAWLVHTMFDMPTLQWATRVRAGPGQWVAEAVATFGLVLVVSRAAPSRASALVAVYIGSAYWFTASTAFANPAAALGRMFSDSFAGIAPESVPGFVLAQCVGAGLAVAADGGFGRSRPEPKARAAEGETVS